MKLKSILSAGLFAAFSTFSLGIHAADSDKAPKKKMKPHSHVEEKGGAAPLKAPEANSGKSDADKANAAKDPKKHHHPRDGK